MEEKELPKLAQWIQNVRKDLKMDQTEFAKQICHYETKYEPADTQKEHGKKVCNTYHRNQVGNWERGISRKISIEGFLSIALLAYDRKHPINYDKKGLVRERNRRLEVAQNQLKEILGEELYPRNLHAALLIQVCRNVLSFQELLMKEKEYEEKFSQIKLGYEEKRAISLEKVTVMIQDDLYYIESQDELDTLVKKREHFFYTANRTLGDRMVVLYEKRPDRYDEKISFQKAVQLYAPNYKDTYTRIYSSTEITKNWIMDLCRHLRFNEKELDETLKLAHKQFVLEEEEEKKASPKTLKEKFELMFLLAFYVKRESAESLPPIAYLLESFSLYTQGTGALRALRKLEKKAGTEYWEYEKVEKKLKKESLIQSWLDYVNFVYSDMIAAANADEKIKKLYQQYKAENKDYFEMSAAKMKNVSNQEDAIKLHYLSALFYTVLVEKNYSGKITKHDRDKIKEQFIDQNGTMITAYRFLSYVLVTFLQEEPLIECIKKETDCFSGRKNSVKFCIYDKKRKKNTKAIDMEEICEDLWSVLESV